MSDFVAAFGLLLVIEGILFAGFPVFMRHAMVSMSETSDRLLRAVGLSSAVVGLIAIWFLRG
jgi:uncharacterized protein YjeT (DUF2065 family)